MPRWLKISLRIIGVLILLVIIFLVGISIYVSTHKQKVIALITTTLNKNLNGELKVGGVDVSFFNGFPNLAIRLKNVSLKDAEWARHHQTLLQAQNLEVSVNTAALLRGTINVKHIEISDATIDLFTDSSGYSNTSVFKKSKTKKNDAEKNSGNSSLEFDKLSLINVTFKVDDQRAKKLFLFNVSSLKANTKFPSSGFQADIDLDVMAKSMAFNLTNGSFIKNQQVQGNLYAEFNKNTGDIDVNSSDFSIGNIPFGISAKFKTKSKNTDFTFNITSGKILWKSASDLLAKNIALKLGMFNLDKPFAVKAIISGGLSGGGDPFLDVTADVKNNRLTVPGTIIDDCNFRGEFTNNEVQGKGFTDANSVIRIYRLNGNYNHLPFAIDTGSISNLDSPIATGNFRSSFPLSNLNYLLGSSTAKFTNGTANIRLRYKADIVNYRFNKPVVGGVIDLKGADITYLPKKLVFKNTSLSLIFSGPNLVLNNINIQTGRSVVRMQGRVNNFLNLYYNSPEKIVVDWQINSPQMYLAEFLGFLGNNKRAAEATKNKQNSGNIIDQLSNVLTKAQANMHMQVANLHYNKFLATDVLADLVLSDAGIKLNKVSLKNAGGSLKLNGNIIEESTVNKFNINTVVSKVNVKTFFYSFDNFGLKDITSQNLDGLLSAKASITGSLTYDGTIVPRSIAGNVDLNLQNGALINYQPLISVGKFVFPFRNLHNISIPNLDAAFELKGENILIRPMQISSSVINADVAGTYSLADKTDITLDVPLRDPKNDFKLPSAERQKVRNKGIVVHVRAKDDPTGKMKIGWNKEHKIF